MSQESSVRCACRQGRDIDGSGFGPCEFCERASHEDRIESHLGLLDDMDHEAKWGGDDAYRKRELRIQALGAAISRRDWSAVEQAHAEIRDAFYGSKP